MDYAINKCYMCKNLKHICYFVKYAKVYKSCNLCRDKLKIKKRFIQANYHPNSAVFSLYKY